MNQNLQITRSQDSFYGAIPVPAGFVALIEDEIFAHRFLLGKADMFLTHAAAGVNVHKCEMVALVGTILLHEHGIGHALALLNPHRAV